MDCGGPDSKRMQRSLRINAAAGTAAAAEIVHGTGDYFTVTDIVSPLFVSPRRSY